jgi:hypothetical protein
MQQMDQYGDATVTGVDADSAEYKLARSCRSAPAPADRIGYDFAGGAELTNSRDLGPLTWTFGAQDRSLGGYATAAYVF